VFNQLDKELDEIYNKIEAKAEYMCKMQVPAAYKPTQEAMDGTLMLMRMPTYLAQQEEEAIKANSQGDWQEQIKNWRNANLE
jgi:hypothetical protein